MLPDSKAEIDRKTGRLWTQSLVRTYAPLAPATAFGTRSTAAFIDCFCSGGGDQEMLAVEADFGGTSSRIPTVKAEVLYEYDSKRRAVNMSASSHEEKCVSSTKHQPTNQISFDWLLLNSALRLPSSANTPNHEKKLGRFTKKQTKKSLYI